MPLLDILDLIKLAFYALFLFLVWVLTRPVYVDFRRRRSGYGVIFNSQTGEAVSAAVIRLKSLQGTVIRTVVSDSEGRYRLVAPKGEYLLEVSKAKYIFPSLTMGKKKTSPFFDDVLRSRHIMISDYGTLTRNIPVDPVGLVKKPSWLTTKISLSKNAQYLIAFLGTGAALYLPIIQPDQLVVWVMFLTYLIVMAIRLVTFKPPQPTFGVVRDQTTGQPLPQAVVRLFEKRFDKLIETQITSPKGRYAFMVNRGDFYILVAKPGYRKVRVNFPNIRQDGFLMAKDVRLTTS